ncbi:MAG: beta-galactosidase trimerization domain-containing protein, partial [Aristaeellaceae bacterium]
VRGGGTLVLTYLTGYVDKDTLNYLNGFPGDGLKDIVGLYSEEIDTLYPSERNGAVFADGFTAEIRDFCEILKVQDAEVLATYTGDFYQGTPVVTRRREGLGQVIYVGARLSREGMTHIYQQCVAGLAAHPMPAHTEHHRRESDSHTYDFYLNHSEEPVTVPLRTDGTELLTGLAARQTMALPPYGVAVVAASKAYGGQPC